MNWLSRTAARLMPAERRDWAEAMWAEADEVAPGLARLAWRAGGLRLIAREALLMRPEVALTAVICCSVCCRMMLSGAPPRDAAKEDGDQECPCLMCRCIRPVASGRSSRAGTPLEAVHGAGTSTLGGYPASRCT